MKKIKLIGLSKSEDLNTYLFPKEESFFPFIKKLLGNLDFDPSEYGEESNLDLAYKNGKENFKEFLEKTNDLRWEFKEGNYIIEVIIGKDRIFLLIYTKKDLQQEIYKIISKLTSK